jgi:4-carboxymuconolactone decarboxylase
MKDIHEVFTLFKAEFPLINERQEALGQAVHEAGGPLPAKTRWLIKLAISAASGHQRSLETHVEAAREAGATEAEIEHTLLLLIPSCGFPAFMEAYDTFRGKGR